MERAEVPLPPAITLISVEMGFPAWPVLALSLRQATMALQGIGASRRGVPGLPSRSTSTRGILLVAGDMLTTTKMVSRKLLEAHVATLALLRPVFLILATKA
jgi:hypothetical protein